MQKVGKNQKYIMPKCHICSKRYREALAGCMRLHFHGVTKETDKFWGGTYYSPKYMMCPKCREQMHLLGPKKFFDKVMGDGG